MNRTGRLAWAALLLAGCGFEQAGPAEPKEYQASDVFLDAPPPGAVGVLRAKARVFDGDPVVVTGRIGGSKDPWATGRVGFTLVDPQLSPCTDKDCPEPWDYCQDSREALAKATARVEFLDGDGQPIPFDAGDYLSVSELQLVTVRGTAKRDRDGNLTIRADGIYRHPLPFDD